MALEPDHAAAGGVWCDEDRTWTWYDVSGLLHRVDGPARIYTAGRCEWYRHGLIHRVAGPAVIYPDGYYQEWRLHGQYHRDAGPAVFRADGHQWWYRHGEYHRVDGPAVIYPDGSQWWFVQDQDITAEVEDWMGANSITWPFTAEQQMEFALRWL